MGAGKEGITKVTQENIESELVLPQTDKIDLFKLVQVLEDTNIL